MKNLKEALRDLGNCFFTKYFVPYSKIDPNLCMIDLSTIRSLFNHWIKGSLIYLN